MSDASRKAWILAQIRVAIAKAELEIIHLEAIGGALKDDLITPFKAVEMMYKEDVFAVVFGVDQQISGDSHEG
jgi:hypothetical protein